MEKIKLDLVPSGKMPSLHASQFDDGRAYHIDLTENRVPYVLDGTETISVIVRKCDNTLVSMDIANTFGNKSYLEFEVVEQMTACAGFNYGEIILEKNGDRLGSLNFYLVVETAPDENGITSQSEIKNLERQVHDIVVEELADNGAEDTGYDNTESGLEATNVQDAVDELAEAVNGKANAIDVYNKSETDEKINALLITDILTGSTVKFENGTTTDEVSLSYSGADTIYMSNDDCVVLYARDTDAVLPYKVGKDDVITLFIKDGTVLENSVRVNFYDEDHNFIDYWSIKTTRELVYDNVKTAFFIQINMNCPNGVVVRKGTSVAINPNYEVKTVAVGTINLYNGDSYFYTDGTDELTVSREITPKGYTDQKLEEVNASFVEVDDKIDAVDDKVDENTQDITEIKNKYTDFYDYSVMPIRVMDIDTTRPYLYGGNENLVGKFKVVVDDDLFCRVVKQVSGSVVYYSDWAKETEYEFEYNTVNQFSFAKGTNYDQVITESDISKIHLYRVEEKNSPKNRAILSPSGVHYIGHAGSDLSAPANSIASFKIAAQDSLLWGIETDIRETSDGVLVCIHDSDISVTTDGTGNIEQMTYAESQQYTIDVGSHIADYPNEKIPTFKEYLTECRRNCKVPVIEVKADVPINVGTLIDNINEYGLNENCIIQSFDYHTLLKCRANGFKGVCFLIITGSVPKTDDEMERFFSQIGWIGNCGLNAYIPVSDIDHSNYLHNLGMLYGSWDTTIHAPNDIFGDLLSDVATISV